MGLTSTDTGAELLAEIGVLEVERARLEALIADRMLSYADHVRHEAQRHDDPVVRDLEASAAADSLGQVLRQPTRTVQVRLSQMRRVRSTLPEVWLAHRSGRIDAFRVQLVAEASLRLCDADSILTLDREVVDVAATRTTAQLKAWLRRFIARTEPDRSAGRERSEAEKRRVYVEHGPDGWSWLNAFLPSTAAHRIDRLLSRLAEKRADGDPHLTLEQARSDVLADLALGRITLDGEPTGRSHGGAVIAVTVPVTSLAGLTDEPGITFDGELALPAELVRELAAEPGTLFHRLLTDTAGRVLDITELGRFPSERLRLGVQARDGTCVFSTCSRPADCATSTTRSHTPAARRAARISGRCVAGTTGSRRTVCSRMPLPHRASSTGSLRSRWTGSRLDPVASWTRCSRSTRT